MIKMRKMEWNSIRQLIIAVRSAGHIMCVQIYYSTPLATIHHKNPISLFPHTYIILNAMENK